MKKITLALGLLACSSFSFAHNVSIDADDCDIDINGQLSMMHGELNIRLPNNASMMIDQDRDLYINGQRIRLSNQQQQWASDYYQGFYNAVPVTAEIANDAINIASTAVGEVFSELFNDPGFADEINQKLGELNQTIQHKFYADNGNIHLQSVNFDDGNFIDEAWESELESMIEEYVMSSLGRLMITLGSQMLTGSMDDFEVRMQRMGEDIEQRVEAQAAHLEQKAHKLCDILETTDQAENKLQDSLTELSGLNVLSVKNAQNRM